MFVKTCHIFHSPEDIYQYNRAAPPQLKRLFKFNKTNKTKQEVLRVLSVRWALGFMLGRAELMARSELKITIFCQDVAPLPPGFGFGPAQSVAEISSPI